MRRWLLAFLLLVVPFQVIWAAAAPYCAHEVTMASKAKKHFGHHEHQHQTHGAGAQSQDDDASGPMKAHTDCGTCHLSCSATVPVSSTAVDVRPQRDEPRFDERRYTSYVPSGPERPDRSEPSAAVRFGGGVVLGLPAP